MGFLSEEKVGNRPVQYILLNITLGFAAAM